MYSTHGSPSSALAAMAWKIGAIRLPAFARAARHDRRSTQRALFSAGDAGADEVQAGGRERVGTPIGVGEIRIAAVDQDVAGREVRLQMRDDAVHWLAGGDHDQHAARPFERLGQRLRRTGRRRCGCRRRPVEKRLRLRRVDVVADDR